jgi:fermentation-respiration switch protein FrsA (DUF1100 family)
MASLTLEPTPRVLSRPDPSPAEYYAPSDRLLEADPSRRADVRFDSGGLALAGHLYRPPGVGEARTPGIVMCGPASSVKEQTLPHYAERFADAGYTVLTFDPRTYGESEGEPRCYYDPGGIIADFGNAVSYMLTRDDVESQIAVVGVCMGGGYAVSAAARDRRLSAAVSVAGGFDIGGTFLANMGSDGFAQFIRQINDLATSEYASGETQYVPATAPELSGGLAFMPNPEAFSYYDRTSRSHAPSWENRVAVKSLQAYFAYNAIPDAELVAPTPLLIVHGTTDAFLWPEFAARVYEAADGDKQLTWIETHNHIELYDQVPYVTEAAERVIEWLAPRVGG